MATEHPKPGLDAMCFKCDDYMKPGLPLRLLQFNHWRANSSPSLSFLPFHHRAGWASWPASPREPQVSAFPPLRLQAYATVSIFLVLLERVLEVRHLVPMLAWSALDRLSHVTSLSFVKDRDTGSVVYVVLWDCGWDEIIYGVWGRNLWTQWARKTFWIKCFWVIQTSYDLDVLFSILYYSKQAREDFSKF